MEGWIKIYRQIKEHWIWDNPLYLKAWLTILITVNHEDKKILIEKELIDCGRGQSLLSLSGWAKLFGKGWTIQKVRTFFDLLRSDTMIITEGLRKTTRLTVCNYDIYQNQQQTENRQTTSKEQADNKQITTNKNEEEYKEGKEDKKIKKRKYADFVLLQADEYEKLKAEHGSKNTNIFIDILNNYKGSNGKKYKSDYMAILNWVIDKSKKDGKYISKETKKSEMVW